jgi:hypothetical protein
MPACKVTLTKLDSSPSTFDAAGSLSCTGTLTGGASPTMISKFTFEVVAND